MTTLQTRSPHAVHIPSDPNQIQHVFVLIHGTWAKSRISKLLARLYGTPFQQWYEEGSDLRNRLSETFHTAVFQTTEWSGSNSVQARKTAAEKLATDLHDLQTQYPRAQHFIIAHSHGGNVACYGLRDHPELSQRIAGVVCLSTPFLHIQPRDLNPVSWPKLLTLNILALIMSAGYLISLIWWPDSSLVDKAPGVPFFLHGEWIHWYGSFEMVWLWTVIYGSLTIFLVVWLTLTSYARVISKTIEKATRLPSSMPPLLVVRVAADEASATLTTFQVAIFLMNKALVLVLLPLVLANKAARFLFGNPLKALALYFPVIGWVTGIIDPLVFLSHYYQIMILFTVLLMVVLLADPFLSKRLYRSAMYIIVILLGAAPLTENGGLFMALVIAMALLPLAVLAAPMTALFASIPLVIGGFLMAFIVGLKVALAHIFLDVTIEPAPPGFHTIYQFGFRGNLEERAKASLNHSISYQAPAIIAAIIDWIRNLTSVKK